MKGLEQTKHYLRKAGLRKVQVEYINENKDVIFDTPIYTDGEMDDIRVEVCDAVPQRSLPRECREFPLTIFLTHEGGTHEHGFQYSLQLVY